MRIEADFLVLVKTELAQNEERSIVVRAGCSELRHELPSLHFNHPSFRETHAEYDGNYFDNDFLEQIHLVRITDGLRDQKEAVLLS